MGRSCPPGRSVARRDAPPRRHRTRGTHRDAPGGRLRPTGGRDISLARPRHDFIRAAKEFIATQRHHMEMEEEHFLPLAEAALSRDDLAALDSELFAETDPLMDPDTEARYATLRNAILSWEAEDSL